MGVSLLLLFDTPLDVPWWGLIRLNFWLMFESETACSYYFITVFSCDLYVTKMGHSRAF